MPRAPLTDAQIAAFRSRALSVAHRLFKKHGLAGLTARALAAELEVSPMTPYRYFRNPGGLVVALRIDAFTRFAAALRTAAAATEGQPLSVRLTSLERAYLDFALAEPALFSLMFEVAPNEPTPELLEASLAAFAPLRDVIAAAEATSRSQVPADVLAHLVWARVHGLTTLAVAGKLAVGRPVEDLLGKWSENEWLKD